MKKVALVAGALLTAALVLTGCTKRKSGIVIGYAQVGAESDWRVANTNSFKETFVPENGYTLIFDDAQQKQENQIKAIRTFIEQGVDYIVVAPVVETGWESVLQDAKEAGKQLAGVKKENNRLFYGLGRFGKGVYTSAGKDDSEENDHKAEMNSWGYGKDVGAVQLLRHAGDPADRRLSRVRVRARRAARRHGRLPAVRGECSHRPRRRDRAL